MAESLHPVFVFLVIFLVVFVLNVVPIFAPPTWSVLSFIAIRFNSNIIILAVVGAVAATLGRLVLAKLSTAIVRQKFLSEGTKRNIDAVRTRLESNKSFLNPTNAVDGSFILCLQQRRLSGSGFLGSRAPRGRGTREQGNKREGGGSSF